MQVSPLRVSSGVFVFPISTAPASRKRATVGAERKVFYKGSLVDTVRDKSDILLIFLLKARRPDLYRDHYDLPNRPMSLGDAATADLIAALPDDKLAELREATDKMRQIVGGQVVVGG